MVEYVKVVYNDCYGGFGLSNKAADLYTKLSGNRLERHGDYTVDYHISRTDPFLVQVVETLGKEANGFCASLKIELIPKGTLYRIDEYDGLETVATMDTHNWEVA